MADLIDPIVTDHFRAAAPLTGTVAGMRLMSEALWAHRPRPWSVPPVCAVWRGAPTGLGELRTLPVQLRTVPGHGDRRPGASDDDPDRLLPVFEQRGM